MFQEHEVSTRQQHVVNGPPQFPGLNCVTHVGTLGVDGLQTLTAGVALPEAVR